MWVRDIEGVNPCFEVSSLAGSMQIYSVHALVGAGERRFMNCCMGAIIPYKDCSVKVWVGAVRFVLFPSEQGISGVDLVRDLVCQTWFSK